MAHTLNKITLMERQIPNQVLASIETSTLKEICVLSPDTDVLMLLLDLVDNQRLGTLTKLKFLTGNGAKYQEIDIVERVKAIGPRRCQGLIGMHNLSGTDWGGKFVRISKKKWIET
jgi:hypothetical protein